MQYCINNSDKIGGIKYKKTGKFLILQDSNPKLKYNHDKFLEDCYIIFKLTYFMRGIFINMYEFSKLNVLNKAGNIL